MNKRTELLGTAIGWCWIAVIAALPVAILIALINWILTVLGVI